MKMATVILCGVVAAAAATGGSIVSSFASPFAGGVPRGLAFNENQGLLYHVAEEGGVIYGLNTLGSVIASYPCPVPARDIEARPGYFWLCTYTATGLVYRVNTAGSILESFFAPANACGITYDDASLWVSSSATGTVYRLTTNGSTLTSFSSPAADAGGLAWDGCYLWLADAASTGPSLYQLTTAGSVVWSCPAPQGRPYGVACDGAYVWYSSMVEPKYVYRVTKGSVGVAPVTWGRIKALYR